MAEYIPKESPEDKNSFSIMTPIGFLFQVTFFLLIIAGAFYLFIILLPNYAAQLTPMSLENEIVQKISWRVESQNKLETQPLFTKLKKHLPKELQDTVVSTSESSLENAYALPGKQILMTQGFLDNAVYENEKLYVLAHEFGHLHYRNPLASFYKNFSGQALLGLVADNSLLVSLSSKVTSLQFSKADEKAADLFALDLLYKATGSIEGVFQFFDRMEKKFGKAEGFSKSLFSNHPVSSERLEYLKEAAKEYPKK